MAEQPQTQLTFRATPAAAGAAVRLTCHRAGPEAAPVSAYDVWTALQAQPEAADRLSAALAAAPFDAAFFETPPVASAADAAALAFEAMLLPAPGLAAMRPEPAAYAEHMGASPAGGAAVFANLGGDAVLVSPKPAPRMQGVSLLPFTRTASPEAQRALWKAVGAAVCAQLEARGGGGGRPLWVSTSGLGVGWLHVRLDNRPKYYQHDAYRAWPRPQ